MKILPFIGKRRGVEDRAYTDAVVALIVSQANASSEAEPRLTAAVAASAGLWGRSFAAALVEPSAERTGLTPYVLECVGRSFVERGESVWQIAVTPSGVVELHQASSWDISGSGPTGWRYHLELSGPDGATHVALPDDAVFHPRINCEPSSPHVGRSPIALAGYTAQSLASADRTIKDELGAPSGYVLPAPLDNLGEEATRQITSDLALQRGRTRLVPSMARGWGEGSPQTTADWRPQRIGADPPASVVSLRAKTHDEILAAAGVPPMMFAAGSQANSAREALRQFMHTTLQPVARLMLAEARRKLAPDADLDFSPLSAADVQGRARAFQSLVAGGMDVNKAAGLSGMLLTEDDQ